MKRTERVVEFDRVVYALDGGANPKFAYNMTNLRLVGRSMKYRYGYTNLEPAPSNYNGCRGFGWVRNQSGVERWISVEEIPSGTLQPYSIDSSGTRTLISTGVVSLSTIKPDWLVTHYADYAYIINPEADQISPTPQPTVYKHLIGTPTDWAAVQDSAYQDPGNNNQTNIAVTSPRNRDYANTNTTPTVTASTYIAGVTFTYPGGALLLSGTGNDAGRDGGVRVQLDFTATEDTTYNDYIVQRIQAPSGSVFEEFRSYYYSSTDNPVVRFNAINYTVGDANFELILSNDKRELQIVIYLGGLSIPTADRNDFQRLTVSFIGSINQANASTPIAELQPLEFGGVYLGATTSAKRIWDSTSIGGLDGSESGIKYATRYTDGGTTYGPAVNAIASKANAVGYQIMTDGSYYGGRLSVVSKSTTAAPWTTIEYLRLGTDNKWRVIGTTANNPAEPSIIDTYQENILLTLPEAPSVSSTGADFAPPFRTSGIVGAFPYKQCMVWLINSGTANLQFSEVGNPLSLYVDGVSYGTDPLQPAQFTMADDESDNPVWGTQAGMIAFIVGNKSAYAMFGDSPSTMSPSRAIPGSRGIVGRYAGTRWRPKGGQYSVAYMDPTGEVWSVSSSPQFVDDTRVTPIEISQPVRGLIKKRLLDEQLAEFPALTLNQVQGEFDEELQALWFILGKRAAVFRQDESGVGWEFYEYKVHSTGALALCEDYGYAGATVSETGSGSSWTNLANAINPNGTPASCAFGLSNGTIQSKFVYVSGFTPNTPIPGTASITSLSFKIRDKKSGDLGVTNIHAYPSVNGNPLGSNLSTNRAVTDSYFIQEFALSTFPTVAQVNANQMGINIRYEQQEWQNTNWNNASNYTITLTGATTVSLGGTVTYTGPGSPPPWAYVNVTSTVVGTEFCPTTCTTPPGPPDTITATVNNGQGTTTTGALPVTQLSVTATSTVRYKVLLTAGVGSLPTITRSATGVIIPPATGWTVQGAYSASATFSSTTGSTVDLDDVQMKFCWSDPTNATSGVSFARTSFVDGKNFAIRDSLIANNGGQIDMIEKDYLNNVWITGATRDAGLTPPDWSWTSQNYTYAPNRARISSVELHTQPLMSTATVSATTDGGGSVNATRMSAASDWFRFAITTSGMLHQVTVAGPPTIDVLETLSFEFNVQSTGKARK